MYLQLCSGICTVGKRNAYIWVHIKDTRLCHEAIPKLAQQGLKLIDLSLALHWAVQTVPNSAPNGEALIGNEKDQ